MVMDMSQVLDGVKITIKAGVGAGMIRKGMDGAIRKKIGVGVIKKETGAGMIKKVMDGMIRKEIGVGVGMTKKEVLLPFNLMELIINIDSDDLSFVFNKI